MTVLSKLEDTIAFHKYLYYNKSAPIISDYEYDLLEKQLLKENPNSVIFSSQFIECPEYLWEEYEKRYIKLKNEK